MNLFTFEKQGEIKAAEPIGPSSPSFLCLRFPVGFPVNNEKFLQNLLLEKQFYSQTSGFWDVFCRP